MNHLWCHTICLSFRLTSCWNLGVGWIFVHLHNRGTDAHDSCLDRKYSSMYYQKGIWNRIHFLISLWNAKTHWLMNWIWVVSLQTLIDEFTNNFLFVVDLMGNKMCLVLRKIVPWRFLKNTVSCFHIPCVKRDSSELELKICLLLLTKETI